MSVNGLLCKSLFTVSSLIERSRKSRKIPKWITRRISCFRHLLKVNLPLNYPTVETALGAGLHILCLPLPQFVQDISTDCNNEKKILRLECTWQSLSEGDAPAGLF